MDFEKTFPKVSPQEAENSRHIADEVLSIMIKNEQEGGRCAKNWRANAPDNSAKLEEERLERQAQMARVEEFAGTSLIPAGLLLAQNVASRRLGVGVLVGSLGLNLDGFYRSVAKPTDGWRPWQFYGRMADRLLQSPMNEERY